MTQPFRATYLHYSTGKEVVQEKYIEPWTWIDWMMILFFWLVFLVIFILGMFVINILFNSLFGCWYFYNKNLHHINALGY